MRKPSQPQLRKRSLSRKIERMMRSNDLKKNQINNLIARKDSGFGFDQSELTSFLLSKSPEEAERDNESKELSSNKVSHLDLSRVNTPHIERTPKKKFVTRENQGWKNQKKSEAAITPVQRVNLSLKLDLLEKKNRMKRRQSSQKKQEKPQRRSTEKLEKRGGFGQKDPQRREANRSLIKKLRQRSIESVAKHQQKKIRRNRKFWFKKKIVLHC